MSLGEDGSDSGASIAQHTARWCSYCKVHCSYTLVVKKRVPAAVQ